LEDEAVPVEDIEGRREEEEPCRGGHAVLEDAQELLEEPVEEGDEGTWPTVGEPAGSRSPAPTVGEILAQLERQPPVPEGSRVPATTAVEEVETVGAQKMSAPAAATVEEAVVEEAQEETPAEGGLVDIASILGAPAVTIVRSNL
jgi:hypothetical protein